MLQHGLLGWAGRAQRLVAPGNTVCRGLFAQQARLHSQHIGNHPDVLLGSLAKVDDGIGVVWLVGAHLTSQWGGRELATHCRAVNRRCKRLAAPGFAVGNDLLLSDAGLAKRLGHRINGLALFDVVHCIVKGRSQVGIGRITSRSNSSALCVLGRLGGLASGSLLRRQLATTQATSATPARRLNWGSGPWCRLRFNRFEGGPVNGLVFILFDGGEPAPVDHAGTGLPLRTT